MSSLEFAAVHRLAREFTDSEWAPRGPLRRDEPGRIRRHVKHGDERRFFLEEVLEDLNRHDVLSLATCFAPEAEFDNPRTNAIGPAGMARYHETMFHAFPDLTYQVTRLATVPGLIMAEVSASGTHQGAFAGVEATGRPVTVPIVFAIDVVDGFITRWASYFDTTTLPRGVEAHPAA